MPAADDFMENLNRTVKLQDKRELCDTGSLLNIFL